MKTIVFFVEKIPDLDHISSHVYKLKDSKFNIFIAGFISESRLQDRVLIELSKYPNVTIVRKLSRDIYSHYLFFGIAWITFFLANIFSKLRLHLLSFTLNLLHEKNFRRNLNRHYFHQFYNCIVCCDHWCSLNKPGYLAHTIIEYSCFRIALPHSYHYLSHPTKYLNAFESYKHTWADIVGFYGDYHLSQVLQLNNDFSDRFFVCEHPRFSYSYYNFRFSLLDNSIPTDNDKIVVFDTPFVETDQLAHQRQLWLSCLSQHFDILLIPHPRSNKLRTSTSIAKSNATLYELLNHYTYFVGIWSTISIDMSWHHKVYITCPYLRPPGYSIIDEENKTGVIVQSNWNVPRQAYTSRLYGGLNNYYKIVEPDGIISLEGHNIFKTKNNKRIMIDGREFDGAGWPVIE